MGALPGEPVTSKLPVLSETFSYDAAGNRLADTAITSYAYDSANRIKSNSAFTYAHDADGNFLTKTDTSTNVTSYTFDSQSELTGVATPSSGTWTYKYDVLGRRVEKSTNSTSGYRYVYDGSQILAILDASNNLVHLYTSEPGLAGPLETKRGDGLKFYYHADALNSVAVHTDTAAAPQDLIEYEAYGQPVILSTTGATLAGMASGDSAGYIGKDRDGETGADLFGLRYYDASIGRFLSEDPLGISGGTDLYVYAAGNPATRIDPFGTDYIDINLSIPLVTAGFQVNECGFYPYLGVGAVTPSASITVAPVSRWNPSQGWNFGFSPKFPGNITVQGSVSGGGANASYGVTSNPGITAAPYYVGSPYRADLAKTLYGGLKRMAGFSERNCTCVGRN